MVVGAGSIGERHVRCFQATGRARLAICETDDAVRGPVARRYGVSEAYASFDQALGAGCDGAVIATPAPLHVPMALRLAQAGVHLLIEKPLSTNLCGIRELEATVVERRLVAAVGYVLRAHPALAAMREQIRDGRFGQPLEVLSHCGQHFPTYRPAYREIYYKDRASGGGAIQDAITHHINAGEWLVGPVERLMADAAHQALDGVAVEDTVHVLTRQGPVLGSYTLNQYQAPNEFTLTVVCTEGVARFEMHRQRWRWMLRPDELWHDEPAGTAQRDDLFVAQANTFLDAIDGLRPPLCSLEEGLQTLRVNLTILAAIERQTWLLPEAIDADASEEPLP